MTRVPEGRPRHCRRGWQRPRCATVRIVVLQLPVTTVRLPFLTVCVQRVSRAPYCIPWPGQLCSRGLAAVLTDPPTVFPKFYPHFFASLGEVA